MASRFYLSVIVLIPLGGIVLKTLEIRGGISASGHNRARLAAYRLTFGASLIAACATWFFGP